MLKSINVDFRTSQNLGKVYNEKVPLREVKTTCKFSTFITSFLTLLQLFDGLKST